MTHSTRFLLLITGLLAMLAHSGSLAVAPAEPVLITGQVESINLSPYLEYFEDANRSISFDQIYQGNEPLEWKPAHHFADNINLGYTKSAFWFRFQIHNHSPKYIKPNIQIGYPVLDYLELFVARPGKEITLISLGDKLPFEARPVAHRNFVIPIELGPDEIATYHLRVETSSSMQLPIQIISDKQLLEQVELEMLWLGLYFGTILVMAFYNLFVFISVREPSYLYYVFFVSSLSLFLASINGISYQYFWPHSTWWNDQSIIFFLACTVLFGGLFTMIFLKIPKVFPRFQRIEQALILLSFVLITGTIFLPYSALIGAAIGLASLSIVANFYAGLVCWGRGDATAKFYLLAWIILFVGGLVLGLNKYDLIERNFVTENAALMGSVIGVIVLSLALADRLNIEKSKRFEAQLNALENERIARLAHAEALQQEKNARIAQEKALNHEREAREAQANALSIQRQATEKLENTVKSRTRELEIANRKLEQLTYTDGLTGIRNRRYLDQCLEHEFSRACREKTPLAVLLIDIDHFKQFNDTHGHLAGDDCLKLIANTINQCALRENDAVTRYGGEEFCVVLPNTDKTGALQVAEEIRQTIYDTRLTINNEQLQVTASVGATSFIPDRHQKVDLFISTTDRALYLSKSQGRNRVCFVEPSA